MSIGNSKNIGPWTRNKSTEIYQNPWIQVFHDEVTRPDGNPGVYGRVLFKNGALGVVALRKDGFIPLVGQHRYPLDTYSWEIPEGGREQGEEELVAIQRELAEETGYSAFTWHCLAPTVHLSNSVTNETGSLWIAKDLSEGTPHPEGCEDLSLQWIHIDEALLWVRENKITDALSIMGLFLAKDFLNQHPEWVTWKN
jgi:8-oxo-dGTP pyrophosphatase MutT (NUDIX family)